VSRPRIAPLYLFNLFTVCLPTTSLFLRNEKCPPFPLDTIRQSIFSPISDFSNSAAIRSPRNTGLRSRFSHTSFIIPDRSGPLLARLPPLVTLQVPLHDVDPPVGRDFSSCSTVFAYIGIFLTQTPCRARPQAIQISKIGESDGEPIIFG